MAVKKLWKGKFMEESLQRSVTITYNDYMNDSTILTNILDEYGFIVVTDILSKEECNQAETLVNDDLIKLIDFEKLDKFDDKLLKFANDVKSGKIKYPQDSIPGLSNRGFMSTHGLPQGEYAWKMRTNARVKKIYETLYKTNDLVVSVDVPFYKVRKGQDNGSDLWAHADHNDKYEKGSNVCYQGILYAWDSTTPDRSTTVVLPKSYNNEYKKLIKLVNIEQEKEGKINHFVNIFTLPKSSIQEELIENFKENARRVQVPAGGLIIFNSKTIHQGYSAGKRLAQPICWEPRFERDQCALRRKLECCHQGIATTHWASIGIKHGASRVIFRKKPRFKSDGKDGGDTNDNIFPISKFKSFSLKNPLNTKHNVSLDILKSNIKDEYLKYM